MEPSFLVYIVTSPAAPRQLGLSAGGGDYGRGPDSTALWREVGAIYPHKSGNGFDVVLHPGLAVFGRLVCIAPDNKPSAADNKAAWPRFS